MEAALKAVLVVWCVVTIGFSFFMWAKYLVFGYTEDAKWMAQQTFEFQNYERMHGAYGAADLQIDAPQVFTNIGNKADFVSVARNPNKRWLASVTFKFVYDGGETEIKKLIILPGAEMSLAVLGVDLKGVFPASSELVLLNIRWMSIDAHAVPDVEKFTTDRLALPVSNFVFVRANTDNGGSLSRISFDIENKTAYSYWRPELYIRLLGNGTVVGYTYVNFDAWQLGEKKHVEQSLISDRVNVTDIQILPELNIFDPSVYIKP
jgi:hypothetical protein